MPDTRHGGHDTGSLTRSVIDGTELSLSFMIGTPGQSHRHARRHAHVMHDKFDRLLSTYIGRLIARASRSCTPTGGDAREHESVPIDSLSRLEFVPFVFCATTAFVRVVFALFFTSLLSCVRSPSALRTQ